MASILKVDTITGVATAGSIAVTGEGNSTTTNLQQGLAKAWHNAASNGASVNDSLNMSSYTDTGTGDGLHNFTSNMGNVNYATMSKVLMNTGATSSHRTIYTSTQATGSYSEESYYLNGAAELVVEDRQRLSVAHGDLA